MKKISRKLRNILCIALVAVMTALSVPAIPVNAAAPAPVCAKSQTSYIQKASGGVMLQIPTAYIYVKNLSSKAKITNLKSSNKKIIPALRTDMNGKVINPNMIELQIRRTSEEVILKSGEKAKITFNVRQNGKTYKLYCNVTFKYADSPFDVVSIKTDKFAKNYAKDYKGYSFRTIQRPKGSKMKVYIKPAKGYEISGITASYNRKEDGFKKVKNGSWISTKDLVQIQVLYTVTKKPANYQKPANWFGQVPSPLHDYATLWFGIK